MTRRLWYELAAIILAAVVGWLLGRVDWSGPEQTPLVVWEERRVGQEWVVPWMYRDQVTLSYHGTVEEARRLYAVMAGKMIAGAN